MGFVPKAGFEPATYRLSVDRSNQLSYLGINLHPVDLEAPKGFEPLDPDQGAFSFQD